MTISTCDSESQVAAPGTVQRSASRQVWFAALLVFLALYLLTAQRGVSWQDSGCFQLRVLRGYYHTDGGLALDHPLYIAVGRLLLKAPLGSFAWRLNAFSGLGMAIALANLAVIVLQLTGKRWIALATAAMLGVAHTAWWFSTVAEIYTWNVAGLTAELWLLLNLLRRPQWRTLLALALVSGLGWSLHNLALLPLPIYGLLVLRLAWQHKLPLRALVAAVVAYMLGAGLILVFIVERALAEGGLLAALQSALFANFQNSVLSLLPSPDNLRINLVLGGLNFVNLLLPLALLGLARARRRLGNSLAAALGALLLIEFLFVLRYDVPDQFSFMLPTLVLLSLFAGLGLATLADRWPRLALAAGILSIVMPLAIYASLPALARYAGVQVAQARELPYRDEVRYWVVPWKHDEDSAERFTREALQQANPDGIIVADLTTICCLRAQQQLAQTSPDVLVWPISRWKQWWEWGKGERDPYRVAEQHAIYIVSPMPKYAPDSLLEHADLEPAGVLYRAYLRPGERPPVKRGKGG